MSPHSSWWPHVELRTTAYWHGRPLLFTVVPEATLEFADRLEVYQLSEEEWRALAARSYHERIAALLQRRPTRVEPKLAGPHRGAVLKRWSGVS